MNTKVLVWLTAGNTMTLIIFTLITQSWWFTFIIFGYFISSVIATAEYEMFIERRDAKESQTVTEEEE